MVKNSCFDGQLLYRGIFHEIGDYSAGKDCLWKGLVT